MNDIHRETLWRLIREHVPFVITSLLTVGFGTTLILVQPDDDVLTFKDILACYFVGLVAAVIISVILYSVLMVVQAAIKFWYNECEKTKKIYEDTLEDL